MKTLFTSLALSAVLCAGAAESCVNRNAAAESAYPVCGADSVLLSETPDGDFVVRRYLVKQADDADYSLRYRISSAKLVSGLKDNSDELKDIDAFVENLMNDTQKTVTAVEIIGYASPDGPTAPNEQLALSRAQDFRAYIDSKYALSSQYNVTVLSMSDTWLMIRDQIAQSAAPNKQEVLKIVDSSRTETDKEKSLKRLPIGTWSYLAKNVLPPLRRVEMVIHYREGTIVEHRVPKSCGCGQHDVVVVAELVDVADDTELSKEDKEFNKALDKLSKKEIKEAEKLAKKEAKQLEKIDKAEAKAAKKIAKEAEKAYNKIEKL